jgi:predicted dehydrogenase
MERSSSSHVRFALIGCGRVSAKHVDAIASAADAKLVAVCDVDPDRARAVAEAADVPWFTGIDEMLAAVPDVDVVHVLTPTGYHAEHALRVAAHGKHVVVEKPIALTVADADAMIAACERAGVKLFVVKPTRYNLPVRRLREAIDADRFGKLVLGTVRLRWCRRQDYYDRDAWRGKATLDGGVLTNQASHYIDLLAWLLGPVTSVSAMTATRLARIETEDTAAALLRFASGALGIVEATTATRPVDLEGSLSVLGERGSVVIGGFSVNELVTWKFEQPTPEDDAIRAGREASHAGHRAFVQDVVAAVRGERVSFVDGIEGRKSLEIIEAIYESARSSREVTLGERARTSALR